LIVPQASDLIPMIVTLTRQLIPFNYVVPGESVNQLIDLGGFLESNPRLLELSETLQRDAKGVRRPPASNEFSGPEYRIVNFVADIPLRLSRLGIPKTDIATDASHVIFVLTEFQLADKGTAVRNESGQSSHDAYKARQHEKVRARLLRGEDEPLLPD
jgi:uncharacterized protein (TIGR04552 family)